MSEDNENKYVYKQNIANMETFFNTNLYKKLEKDLKKYLDLKEEVEKNINKIVCIIKEIINLGWYNEKDKEFYIQEYDIAQYRYHKSELEKKEDKQDYIDLEIITHKDNILEKFKFIDNQEKEEIKNKNKDKKENAEEIYRDPDEVDNELYSYIKNNKECYKDILKDYKVDIDRYNKYYFQGNNEDGNVDLSLDGIIGWKAIIDVLIKENKEISDVAKIYEVLRNPKYNGHLLWPAHGRPTINQARYNSFNDRIDYILFDIKKYYESNGDNCVLKKTYAKEDTKKWLDSFDDVNDVNDVNDFNDFIKKMNLIHWCTLENGKYEVMDLSQDIRKQIKNNNKKGIHPIEDYLDKSKMIKIKTKEGRYIYKYPVTKDYLNNIIYIVSGGEADDDVYIK